MSALALGLAGAAFVLLAGARLLPVRGRGRRPRRVTRSRALVRAVCAGAAFVVWPPALVAVAAWWVAAPQARARRDAARRDRLVRTVLPDVTDWVVLAIRAGCTPFLALELLAPLVPAPFDDAFTEVLHRHRAGVRFAVALEAVPEREGERARLLVRALAADDGLPLGPRLDALAAEARAERRREAEAAARRLPVTLSFPLAACILPAFVLITVVPLLGGALQRLRW